MEFLFQQITYHTYANSEEYYIEWISICEKNEIGCCITNTLESYRASLLIPPISPTDFDTSNICKVRYILQVSESVLNYSLINQHSLCNLLNVIVL